MKKRILSALLALLLCAAALPVPARAADTLEGYSDLEADAWYASGVRYCLDHGLMSGIGQRKRLFAPDAPVTRSQLAATLWRMEGEPETGLTMQYTDVPEDAWYAPAVRWAMAEGVMTGYSVLIFAPDDPVSREQLAEILWRYAAYRNGSVPAVDAPQYELYGDRGEVSEFADEAMRWACGLGIISGLGSETKGYWLMPWGPSSRAVVATMLMRFCLDMGIFE